MTNSDYRVLARKYRPKTFDELIGQDTLVRTLGNAFQTGRIAHAFMLTGVRGVGKTTTARIIARALNCIGPDGTGKPTMTPCGLCDPCRSIAEDRHPDVIEMDAASRTGVDDMRELIDSVRYRPVSARYKIYIVDEVHMLSKAAFNALLKTLEEPPPDIKFIFATTEINKVPVTVLSRCQRYTLPRIPPDVLTRYFGEIAARESVEIEPGALALVARAADGSVRDGLSILDQAIALGFGGTILETAVRAMLGVADRGLTVDLFESLMQGDAVAALDRLSVFYTGGTDPAMVIQDLLDVTHAVTRAKLDSEKETLFQDQDRARAAALAKRLGIAALARTWQGLLKGLGEVQTAPNALKAAEMVLIRLTYISDLPPIPDLIKGLQAGGGMGQVPPPSGPVGGSGGGARATAHLVSASTAPVGAQSARLAPMAAPETVAVPAAPAAAIPESFEAMMRHLADTRQIVLYAQVARFVHLVDFAVGQIELRLAQDAPRDLVGRLSSFLTESTGIRWLITISRAEGRPTISQQAEERAAAEMAAVRAHPWVKAALAAFPGATIDRIKQNTPSDDPAAIPPDPIVDPIPAVPVPDNLYEEDDPGPFLVEPGWDLDDDDGDE